MTTARRGVRRLVLYAGVFVGAVLVTTWLVGLVTAADAGERAANRAAAQAQAQARITTDQRQAYTRRVDLLTGQVGDARTQLEAQAKVLGRQEQAIRDLAAQVQALGGRPVATAVTSPRTRPTPAPTTAPAPVTSTPGSNSPRPSTSRPSPHPSTSRPSPQPTPQPPPDTGGLLTPVCTLLRIDC